MLGVSQVVLVVKNPPADARDVRDRGFDLWVGKMPWRREWQPTPVFLPGESHGLYGPQRVGHDWATLTHHDPMRRAWGSSSSMQTALGDVPGRAAVGSWLPLR